MCTFSAANLLPGIADEITSAKSETIWHNSMAFFNSPKLKAPYIFVSSFCEHKKHKQRPQRSPIKKNPRSISSPTLPPPSPPPKTAVQPSELFPSNSPIEMIDSAGERWYLRCICDVKSDDGYLICCDKCGYWQHGICFNYNSHTFPENYVCAFCDHKTLRCKCGNNHDFRFSIIKCSQCGNYVHRRCEGLGYGPMPEGDFQCHFCGKANFKTTYRELPKNFPITDTTYYFDPLKLNQMINPNNNQSSTIITQCLNGPFNKLLFLKLSGQEVTAKKFCEMIYHKYRSFFFLCHSLHVTSLSRKKRNRLLTSFLHALDYLCYNFYGISHEKVVEVFDNLIYTDLYQTHVFKNDSAKDEALELSENARIELPNIMNSITKFSMVPRAPQIRQTHSGLMAMCDFAPDQFIALTDGLIGDLEEFPYDPKVDSAYYQISGTRFVLDATHVPSSPLHLMRRSIYGNCTLRLINIGDATLCALFIGRNYITYPGTNEHFNGVKSGTILTLGIDFLPAVLRDSSKWLQWHCNDVEEEVGGTSITATTTVATTTARAARVVERGEQKQKQKKRPKIENDVTKKRRGRKLKKKNDTLSTEITLFGLFDNEEPGDIMCRIIDNGEPSESEELSDTTSETSNQPTRSVSWNDVNEASPIIRSSSSAQNNNNFVNYLSNDPVGSMSRLLSHNVPR